MKYRYINDSAYTNIYRVYVCVLHVSYICIYVCMNEYMYMLTVHNQRSFAVTQPNWRTSYWPANVNTHMSTPLVSLHHGVQISLPIPYSPFLPLLSFAATVSTPTLAFSFTHSPLVRRVSHLLIPPPRI
jgi:hypothetical protein